MNWRIALLAAVVTASNARAQGTEEAESDGYPVLAFYVEPRSPHLRPWYEWVARNRPLDALVETLSARYALPVHLPVVYRECGTANAYYSPGDSLISICYELAELFGKFYAGADGAEAAVRNSLEFIFYHEFGHALAHLLSLPITGREEDAVDQLATYLLLSGGDAESVGKVWQAAVTFRAFAARRGPITAKLLADEHSLDDQRYYSLLCYVVGSRYNEYSAAAVRAGLTTERLQRCPREYAQLAGSWAQLLDPIARAVDYEPLNAHAFVRVFNSEDATRAPNDEFEQKNLLGIGIQLRFVMPPRNSALTKQALVTCQVLNDDEEAVGQVVLDMTPQHTTWVNEVNAASVGYRSRGRWTAGDYAVVCTAEDRVVATTAFTIK